LQQEVEQVRSRLRAAYAESETEVGKALERRLAQALNSFQEDAERLAQTASQRWHAAINETLTAIPQMLAAKLREGSEK
jgi:DNA anti-recombination protein RmuC